MIGRQLRFKQYSTNCSYRDSGSRLSKQKVHSSGTHMVSGIPDVLDQLIRTSLVQITSSCCAASHHNHVAFRRCCATDIVDEFVDVEVASPTTLSSLRHLSTFKTSLRCVSWQTSPTCRYCGMTSTDLPFIMNWNLNQI